LCNFIVTTLC